MSSVKLDLRSKSVPQKIHMGRDVLIALGTPVAAPYTALAAALKTATDTLESKSNDAAMAQGQAEIATGQVTTAEVSFGDAFGALGRQVQTTTSGDASGIMATGFGVRSNGTPVTSLTYVENFSVTTTNLAGSLDFSWDRSKGEVAYEIRGEKAGDPAGQFAFSKRTTKTRLRSNGFESGVDYTFEIRALGSGEMESPWCDPFTKKAS